MIIHVIILNHICGVWHYGYPHHYLEAYLRSLVLWPCRLYREDQTIKNHWGPYSRVEELAKVCVSIT